MNKLSLAKDVREALLSRDDLPSEVREVLELRQQISKSSTAKFQQMLNHTETDGRARGCYIHAGAATTGRASSRGIQMHNLKRESAKDPEAVIEQMERGGLTEKVMDTLSMMIRAAIIPEDGNKLVWGDWSAIEARALPWLAKSPIADAALKIFRECDADPELPDIYERAAASIYKKPANKVTKDERQVGKVATLALGYGGGVGAFQAMARGYGVRVDDNSADQIKHAWRASNPWAKTFWDMLHSAAVAAMRNPGVWFPAGRVSYMFQEKVLNGVLWCALPSGRPIAYPNAKLEIVDGPYGPQNEITSIKGNWFPKVGDPWPRVRIWKGLAAENVCQATCGDLLRDCLVRAEKLDSLAVIGSTHDEVIAEAPAELVEEAEQKLKTCMESAPAWVDGLPLIAETQSGPRYRK